MTFLTPFLRPATQASKRTQHSKLDITKVQGRPRSSTKRVIVIVVVVVFVIVIIIVIIIKLEISLSESHAIELIIY